MASPSGEPPGVERAFQLFSRFDNFAGVRAGLRRIAELEESWAGIPMPLEGRRLVIEPKFPRADALSDLLIKPEQRAKEQAAEEANAAYRIRNRFWSFHRRAFVVVVEEIGGKVHYILDHGQNAVERLLDTLDCSSAWGLEQESRAVHTLGTLVRHHQLKCYLLTGMFIESSKRTNLAYLFRRLRPTIVLDTSHAEVRVRCALCMHPIAFYEGTWAGAMTPTDDVIAHLMLMRGDEAMLWRRSNQHPIWRPEAGVF